jgi:hypothetical protein
MGEPAFVHVAPDGTRRPYSPEDNATIASAKASGASEVRLDPIVLQNGQEVCFEIRFGENACSTRLPEVSPSRMIQVNLDDGNMRIVWEEMGDSAPSIAQQATMVAMQTPFYVLDKTLGALLRTLGAAADVVLPGTFEPLPKQWQLRVLLADQLVASVESYSEEQVPGDGMVTLYQISVNSQEGSWEIKRWYSDFAKLDAQLRKELESLGSCGTQIKQLSGVCWDGKVKPWMQQAAPPLRPLLPCSLTPG